MRRLTFLIFALFFIQCSSARLSDLYQKYNRNDYLYWSIDRQLTWDDFQGTPTEASGGAASEINIYNPATIERPNIFSSPKLTAICVFDKKTSWVKKNLKTNNLLLYNQVIFNIYELYTRKLRQNFIQTDFSGEGYIKKFHKLAQRMNQHIINEVQTFRVKSKYGENAEEVLKWNKHINSELEKFKDYKVNYNSIN